MTDLKITMSDIDKLQKYLGQYKRLMSKKRYIEGRTEHDRINVFIPNELTLAKNGVDGLKDKCILFDADIIAEAVKMQIQQNKNKLLALGVNVNIIETTGDEN